MSPLKSAPTSRSANPIIINVASPNPLAAGADARNAPATAATTKRPAPRTWAQVAKAAPKKAGVAQTPTPPGTVPRPPRYRLTVEEEVAFRAGILPIRLLGGFISRAVGSYRHLAGLTRPGPLPGQTFAMLKRTAARNLHAVCTRLINNKTKHETLLAAQAAFKARTKPTASVAPPVGGEVIKVVEKVVEVEKVVTEYKTSPEVLAQLTALTEQVTELTKALEVLRARPAPVVPTLYELNHFKGVEYCGHTAASVNKWPKETLVKNAFSGIPEDSQIDVMVHPTYFDLALRRVDGSVPAVTLLRVSRKTHLVVSSAPLPAVYAKWGVTLLSKVTKVSGPALLKL